MTLTDTHCHIHEESYAESEEALRRAREAGVQRLLCVGTDETTSADAVRFAAEHEGVYATIGLHPHDATNGLDAFGALHQLQSSDIVAVGECGLDYYYDHSPRERQIEMLHAQIELALERNLPMVFHVREAFDDFWPIYDQYQGVRGVVHSFTDSISNMERALERELCIGVNGISTFTKNQAQREMYQAIPLESLLLETDAPFLTPAPHRGKVNEPAYVRLIAEHLAQSRGISLEELVIATEANATRLFSLK